ncbi:MAG TPA: MFS transporter [Candidatus Cybelea sp.]
MFSPPRPCETRSASTWRVLALRPFRVLLIADFVSNLGFFAQAVGTGWLMTSLTTNATIVSLVQTAASLPLFLVAIPAGVLADLVDRRRLIRITNVALAVPVGILALLTAEHVVTPALLLAATFIIASVEAVQEPAWGALIPEIVPDNDLPPAIALFGIDFNLSRVVGPPVAGLLVGIAGPAAAFAVNALTFVPTIVVMRPRARWVWPKPAALREGTASSFAIARNSAPVRDVLLRNASFGVCASVIFALLPLYARVGLHATPAQFGLLFAMLGLGSLTVAPILGPLRERLGISNTVLLGTIVLGICLTIFGLARSLWIGYFVLFAAGFGWLTVLTVLNTAIQFALPAEHRAAGFAFYLVTSQGIMALGSLLWGAVAARFGSAEAFIFAGILFVALGILTRCVPLPWRSA